MGLIADFKAVRDLDRINSGGKAKLSISQIACLITSMTDAQQHLSGSEFQAVYALYKELRRDNTKVEMDKTGYIDAAVKIIKQFDTIAPFEQYSGDSELEFSLDDIRETADEPDGVE
jgi:hypothetical protein